MSMNALASSSSLASLSLGGLSSSLSSSLGLFSGSMSFGSLLRAFPAPPNTSASTKTFRRSLAQSTNIIRPKTLDARHLFPRLPVAAAVSSVRPPSSFAKDKPALPTKTALPMLIITSSNPLRPRLAPPASPAMSPFARPDADPYWTDLRCALGACAFTCPACGGSSGSYSLPHSAPAHIQTFADRLNAVDRPARSQLLVPGTTANTLRRSSSFFDAVVGGAVTSLGRKMGTLSKKFMHDQ